MFRSTLAIAAKRTASAARNHTAKTTSPLRYASTTTATSVSGFSPVSVLLLAAATGGAGYYVATQFPILDFGIKTARNSAVNHSLTSIKYGSRQDFDRALERLRQVIPPEHVTIDEEEMKRHGYSASSYHNEGLPQVVVYPQSTEEVVHIVKIANEYKIPVIPFSGGTSLEGNYTAPYGGISIDLSYHMNNIIMLHAEDMDIVVQPGVQWEELNEYLKPHRLFFPLDPGPGACIGGMVGTGCSGTNAVRYGTMREWVLNLTVVLSDGTVVKTRQRPRKSSAGYDLTKLFIGSEGTLGIVTEATLKLAVLPAETSVAVCDFPSIRDAAAVSAAVVRAGVQVRAVELLDDVMMKAINLANPQLGYVEKPTLFFKFSGNKAQIEDEIKTVAAIVKLHNGGKFKFARSEKDQKELWEGRKVALWSSTLLKPGSSVWTTDVCVPVSSLPDLIADTKKDLEKSILPAPMVGHVGDGNFHLFILLDPKNPEELKEARRINDRLVERAIKMEGSCTGEHGVGVGKRKYLPLELGETTIELMRTIKHAIDPNSIMNPGKVIPDKQ